ncbi:hypothetical protein MLD38_037244 [Melastoma candidum]|uniref:Uncharacterized protein n=1 Tax=Melastoma candidum TaxID=119954 RepID=A0ACB9LMQ7_9MYRT|nr:hypothetical protein MLD38_037244 [Melastoma candidum]
MPFLGGACRAPVSALGLVCLNMEGRADVMDLEVASLSAKVCAGAQECLPCSPPKNAGSIAVGGLEGGIAPSFKDVLKGTRVAVDLTRPGTSAAAKPAAQSNLEEGLPSFPEFGGGGCPLLLHKWQAGMVINEEPTALPCWMRLYGIPLELWHARGVQYLASSVGQLLKTDARSFNPANMGTARLQVECAAKNGLNKTIEAIDSRGNSLSISIVYETKALCCKACGVLGHDEGSCSKRLMETGKDKAVPAGNQGGKRSDRFQQVRSR